MAVMTGAGAGSGFLRRVSLPGMVVGTLFFVASLAPSLLPRSFALQGALSGCSLAAGYLAGVFLSWLWAYLELPRAGAERTRRWRTFVLAGCAVTAAFFLWRASEFQNSVRSLMEMPPVEGARGYEVAAIALLVFVVLLGLVRLFVIGFRVVSARLERWIPRRTAQVIGLAIVAGVAWMAIDGLLFRVALRIADSSLQRIDALIEPDVAQPQDPALTGSPQSLVAWDEFGRMGRQFIAATPGAEAIRRLAGGETMQPIRVYVGLNSAEEVEDRARLALDEMLRVGAFDRSVLVVATPTGTGWIDPAAVDTLEILHRGDVATVTLQYSYLLSWLSLLVEPSYGSDSARALFRAVYDHWTSLPKETRPRLYLYGLSLGALNSDRSTDIYDVLADPFDGALWVGPPFSTETWQRVSDGRQPESPAWLPRFRDGSIVRFANQHGLAVPDAPWGPLRIVFLQYASDPVTFFRPDAWYRVPPWLSGERGPDVSPAFRWFPFVSLLQLGLDMALATTAPMGFGHVYAPEHHVDPWVQVTRPQGWDSASLTRLKAALAAMHRPDDSSE